MKGMPDLHAPFRDFDLDNKVLASRTGPEERISHIQKFPFDDMLGLQHQSPREAKGIAVIQTDNISPSHLEGKHIARPRLRALEGAVCRQVSQDSLDAFSRYLRHAHIIAYPVKCKLLTEH